MDGQSHSDLGSFNQLAPAVGSRSIFSPAVLLPCARKRQRTIRSNLVSRPGTTRPVRCHRQAYVYLVCFCGCNWKHMVFSPRFHTELTMKVVYDPSTYR